MKIQDNQKKRCISLDVLRGMTVALMIIVNNPGSWSKIYAPLRHAPWEGCTLCDLVFPFFLFCVGASMVFSLGRFDSPDSKAVKKIVTRGLLLYVVGLLLTAFPFYPGPSATDPSLSFWENWLDWFGGLRLTGVLARIAMCYVLASLLVLWLKKNTRAILAAVGVLSVLHLALLLVFAGPEGAFSLEGNFARKVDMVLLGEEHMYHGYGLAFDPEGILGALTGACTVLLGYIAGTVLKDASESSVARLYTGAALSLLAGVVLSIWIPFSKPLWSVSYVFYTAGWAMAALAFLSYFIDVKGHVRPFAPFRALGMNALAIFVLSGLVMKCIWRFTDWDYTKVFGGSEPMSLLFAVLFMLAHLAVAIVLYRKKIFIKL